MFTVTGIQTASAACSERNVLPSAFVGVLTGVGGGVMRDLLLRRAAPDIFVKHFYACASMIGAHCLRLFAGHCRENACGNAYRRVVHSGTETCG